jgi:hypothetical protein
LTPNLQLYGGGGLVPANAQYPVSYTETNVLSTGGNITLQNPNPWGWGNTATQLCLVQGFSVSGAPTTCPPSGGLNSGVSNFAAYASVDNVQLAQVNQSMPPAITESGTFSATSFTPATPFTATQLALLQQNMQVETGGSSPWRSYITGWAANGASLNVAGWYQGGNTAAGQIPSGTSTLYVHVADRIWNTNTVVSLTPTGFATHGTGLEVDVDNGKVSSPSPLQIIGVLVGGGNGNAGGANPYDISSMYVAEGGAVSGYESRSGHSAFFLVNPDTLTGSYSAGFLTYQTSGPAFESYDSSNGWKFSASSVDGSLDLGAYGLASSPVQSPAIRFHSVGGASSSASASIAVSGGGAMAINASSVQLTLGTQGQVLNVQSAGSGALSLTPGGTGAQSLELGASGGGSVVALSGFQAGSGQLEMGSSSATGYIDWHLVGEASGTNYQVRATSDLAGELSIYGADAVLLGRFASSGVTLPSVTETVSQTPASSNASCVMGQHTWDGNYEYRCVATNTWKRAALSSF